MRGGVLVEVEVGGELGQEPQPGELGLAEGQAPVALLGRDALGGDEGAQPGDGQAVDGGHHLGLAVALDHGSTPFRGS